MSKPGSGRKWSPDDEAHCLAMIDRGVSYAEIGKILGRTEKAVANRAVILGRNRVREYPNVWSDEDDATLQRLWAAGATDATASKVLMRTPAAIEARRRVLGLQRRQPRKQAAEAAEAPKAVSLKLFERDLYRDWNQAMTRISQRTGAAQ